MSKTKELKITAEEFLKQKDEHGNQIYWIGTFGEDRKVSVSDAIMAMEAFNNKKLSEFKKQLKKEIKTRPEFQYMESRYKERLIIQIDTIKP